MTPEQKLEWAVVAKYNEWNELPIPSFDESVTKVYEELCDIGELDDARAEVRWGEVETNIPKEYSRHYESKSVAMKLPDGSWVGWTYWFGGGKHGEPSSIDWMPYSYDLDCKEEEKMVVVRTFTLKEK